MYNYNRYIEELLEQQQQNQSSPYQNMKKLTGNISKTGKNMTTVGNYMKDNLSNPALQKLGANISGVGSKLSNGANTVNNVISPQNYFKGFAPRPFDALSQGGMAAGTGTVGATDAVTQGAVGGLAGTAAVPLTTGTTGSAVGSAIGSEIAGTGSALGGSAIGNAIGAEVGGTAAGAGAGSAVGSAIGSEVGGAAAGGAAAGGSAAGAGAAAGPIGALVALGVMAAMGNHRKQAKKSGEALLKSLNKESNSALEQTNEFAKNAVNQTQDYSQPVLPTANNGMTGGAAPITQEDINAQAYQNYMNNSPIANAIQQQAPQQNLQSVENTAPLSAGVSQEEAKRGLLDKFMSGVSDFSRGFQENRDNGFNPNNLTADKFTETVVNPANTQKITDYQNELANNEAYNDWANRAGVDKAAAINAIAEGKNSGNADVDNWIKNNQDAYKETKETKTYDKGKMARAGEFLGSAARIAQNPLVQGLVAGGLSAALTGNPLYGLGQGYKFANNRAMSNVYGDVLKQYGVDVPNVGMFGNISGTDMRNIGNMAETHAWHEYLNQKNADELARKTAKDEADKRYKEDRIQVLQQNADTNKQKAENQKNKPVKTTKSGGSFSKYQLVNGKDGKVYKLNKATGEYQVVGSQGSGGVDTKSNNTNVATNNTPQSEEDFRNRVFKNKKNSSIDKGWAF